MKVVRVFSIHNKYIVVSSVGCKWKSTSQIGEVLLGQANAFSKHRLRYWLWWTARATARDRVGGAINVHLGKLLSREGLCRLESLASKMKVAFCCGQEVWIIMF